MVQNAGPHTASSHFQGLPGAQGQSADTVQNPALTPLGSAPRQGQGGDAEGEAACCPAVADASRDLGCSPAAVKQAKQPATSTAAEAPREKAPSSQMLFLEKNCCGTWPLNGTSVQLISAWS